MRFKKIFLLICIISLLNISAYSAVAGNVKETKKIDNLNKSDRNGFFKQSLTVVVVGGPAESCHKRTAKRVVDIYGNLGYNVKYLIRPSLDEMENTITSWIPNNIGGAKKLALYFIDHGSTFGFSLGRDLLTPDDLGSWMNEISSYYSSCLLFVEACFSGVFITDELSANNRIIITSTGPYTSSFKDPSDESFFAKVFLNGLEEGDSYGQAWMRADEYIDSPPFSLLFSQQNPKIDDNGDGEGHGTNFPNSLPIGGDGSYALGLSPKYKAKTNSKLSLDKNQFPILNRLIKHSFLKDLFKEILN